MPAKVQNPPVCTEVYVWLGRNTRWEPCTAAGGGKCVKKESGRVGHAAMLVGSQYVSFWPRNAEDPDTQNPGIGRLVADLTTDIQNEKGLPDCIITLHYLNVPQMLAALTTARQRIDNGALAWYQNCSISIDITSDDCATANCATFVFSLLRSGGLVTKPSPYYEHCSMGGPQDKEFYKVTRCGITDSFLAGMTNYLPTTNAYFTPKGLLLRAASAAEGHVNDVQGTIAAMRSTRVDPLQ